MKTVCANVRLVDDSWRQEGHQRAVGVAHLFISCLRTAYPSTCSHLGLGTQKQNRKKSHCWGKFGRQRKEVSTWNKLNACLARICAERCEAFFAQCPAISLRHTLSNTFGCFGILTSANHLERTRLCPEICLGRRASLCRSWRQERSAQQQDQQPALLCPTQLFKTKTEPGHLQFLQDVACNITKKYRRHQRQTIPSKFNKEIL